jgi:LysM repeat protein
MSPEAAAPSAMMYRGSLVALVVASLVAVFLFVRPPESKSAADAVHTLATSTPISAATATPTPRGNRTATAVSAITTTATAAPSAAASATTTKQYVVKDGDTLSGIAAANGTTVEAIEALNPGLTPQTLGIGTTLNLP